MVSSPRHSSFHHHVHGKGEKVSKIIPFISLRHEDIMEVTLQHFWKSQSKAWGTSSTAARRTWLPSTEPVVIYCKGLTYQGWQIWVSGLFKVCIYVPAQWAQSKEWSNGLPVFKHGGVGCKPGLLCWYSTKFPWKSVHNPAIVSAAFT